MRHLRCCVVAVIASLLQACGGLPSMGMLGENFPPHDIGFVSYQAPEFPYRLRATAIGSGYAIVAMTVGADGRIEDAVALEASHPDFVEAVFAVAGQWQLQPAESGTQPRREVLHFVFRRSGVATSMSHREAARAPFDEIADLRPAIRTVSATELMPVRLGRSAGEAADPGITGSVDVSFVIDSDGRVRVPVVALGPDPTLVNAALAIVSGWRFEAPLVDGEPVLIEVARTLTFGPAAP